MRCEFGPTSIFAKYNCQQLLKENDKDLQHNKIR